MRNFPLVNKFLTINPDILSLIEDTGITLDDLKGLPYPSVDYTSGETVDAFRVMGNIFASCDFSAEVEDKVFNNIGPIVGQLGMCAHTARTVDTLRKNELGLVDRVLSFMSSSHRSGIDFYYRSIEQEMRDIILDNFELRMTEGPMYNVYINGVLARKIEDENPKLAEVLRNSVEYHTVSCTDEFNDERKAACAINLLIRMIWIDREYMPKN